MGIAALPIAHDATIVHEYAFLDDFHPLGAPPESASYFPQNGDSPGQETH
jgi:hypothetical protein